MSTASRPTKERPGTSAGTSDHRRHLAVTAAEVVVAAAVLFAVMVGIGELVTRVLKNRWPVDAEDGIDRYFAGGRTPGVNHLTYWLAELGNTMTIIGLMIALAIALRLVLHRWRESVFLVLAVSTQALVFLLTTLVVKRQRPEGVHRLDSSPPTSSYPSGHTGAAVALYGSLAVVVIWALRNHLLKILLVVVLLALPALVGYSRLYRGMHHPTDVAFATLNGVSAIFISRFAVLREMSAPDRPAEAA